jgi:hypothetical protein
VKLTFKSARKKYSTFSASSSPTSVSNSLKRFTGESGGMYQVATRIDSIVVL